MLERVYARIDLDHISANISTMYERLGSKTPIMAVIKANAYGHGAVSIARMLEDDDRICGYAVATAEEAMQLRRAGVQKKILIMGYVFAKDYERLIREQIRFCVFSYETARELSEAAGRVGERAYIHIKIDTGMHRIGFVPSEDTIDTIEKIHQLPLLCLEGVFTHFSRADEADKTCTEQQQDRFLALIGELERRGITFAEKHCSNSAAILELPEYHMDMVRAGIILYGLWPSEEVDHHVPLQPALSLYSHIIHIKILPDHSPVSYGGTYLTNGQQRIATIPVGYGDGYPRGLSNKGEVLICGKRAKIIGRVCMDQMMVDITHIPEADVLEKVTLVGKDGTEEITLEELGERSGRFNYEFACDLGIRVPRYFYRGGRKIGEMDFFA